MSRSRFPFPTLIFMTLSDTQNIGDSRLEGGSGGVSGSHGFCEGCRPEFMTFRAAV